MARSCPRVGRRGISLLEVLISMFVLLVGLAGIASLLPAGRSEIMQGVKLDYAMMVGRNGFRELTARELLEPPSTSSAAPFFNGWYEGEAGNRRIWRYDLNPALPFDLSSGATDRPAIVIDPLGLFASTTYGNVFPYGASTTQPFLTRVSPFGTKTGTDAKALADAIFRCGDDLSLIPNTTTRKDPPQQQILRDKRSYEGNYSWLATVVPDPAGSAVGTPVRVSVAVFYKRDLSTAGAGESFCRVISLPGLGVGGGEVVIFNPVTPLAKPLRPGQWVMMAGFDNTSGARRDHFHWYKVLAASSITEVNQLPTLNANRPSGVNSGSKVQPVTLAGTDWGSNLFPANPTTGLNVTSPTGWPTMFILDNVIAVYEKSVELQFQ